MGLGGISIWQLLIVLLIVIALLMPIFEMNQLVF